VRLLVVLLAIVSGGGASMATASTDATHASLRLASTRPLAIRGKGFSAHERVRVQAASRVTRTKRIRAAANGTFVVSFSDVSYDRCRDGLTVTATGTTHSARLKLPQPQCPVP
jgi:hypothetical protein